MALEGVCCWMRSSSRLRSSDFLGSGRISRQTRRLPEVGCEDKSVESRRYHETLSLVIGYHKVKARLRAWSGVNWVSVTDQVDLH